MKSYKKIIPLDIFHRGVAVVFGSRDTLVDCMKGYGYKNALTNRIEDALNTSEAVVLRLDEDAIIYIEHKVTEGVLIHEIVHAASHILGLVDIDNEEMLSYLMQYLYEQIVPWARTTHYILEQQ